MSAEALEARIKALEEQAKETKKLKSNVQEYFRLLQYYQGSQLF